MEKNCFYVTTAIPYVNAAPHIGHALEFIQTDVIARYHRLIGDETYFLTGTDENALKNVQAAEKAGTPIKDFVNQNSQRFEDLKKALNISFDDFIRTTEDRHIKGAQKLWQACNSEDIYKKKYKGLYCVGCETFYTKKESVGGKCPEHDTSLETIEEENYFFRLSNYEGELKELIQSNKLKIIPEARKNEVLSFIDQGLEDFSISRSVERAKGWGVPVPNDLTQIIYVWFDALTNYITGLDYAKDGELFKKFWIKNPNRIHIIGKGIIRFHAIYWPAMLLSANLPVPKEIFVHGYLTVEGQKISKSLGNTIDPFELAKKYGTDPVRYYLLAKFSSFEDGDFSENRFKETYNADLANGLGNLISRVAGLIDRYFGGKVPQPPKDPDEHPLRVDEKIHNWKKVYKDLDESIRSYRFNEALASVWKFISAADKYVDESKPWDLSKKDKEKLAWVIYGLADSIHQLGWILLPLLPETSKRIAEAFQLKRIAVSSPSYKDSWTNIKSGTQVRLKEALFPRIS